MENRKTIFTIRHSQVATPSVYKRLLGKAEHEDTPSQTYTENMLAWLVSILQESHDNIARGLSTELQTFILFYVLTCFFLFIQIINL